MPTPHLDILKREPDGNFVWLEAAGDLKLAKMRLEELAERHPGEYFVFDQKAQQIVAKVGVAAAGR
jgi:hypothetical protein